MRLFDFSEPVGRGAAVLDDAVHGWHDLVDLDALDLRCGHSCVLGQLGARRFGLTEEPYAQTVALLHLELQTVRLGFNLAVPRPFAWSALRRAWVQEVTRRRAHGAPARQADYELVAGATSG